MAVAVPESGVVGLPENGSGSVLGSTADQLGAALERADAVLIGSGLDDPQQSADLLAARTEAILGCVLDVAGRGLAERVGATVQATCCGPIMTSTA